MNLRTPFLLLFLLASLNAEMSAVKRGATGEQEAKRFLCQECDYSTNHKSTFSKHRLIHTGERPYRCQHCDYRTTRKYHITVHERTHTGAKSYKCSFCDYRATQKSNITTHEQTHTGEKPFKCQFCDYKATRKYHITVHERTHTREKLFQCSLCNYSAAQKNTLVRHQRTHGNMPVVDDNNFDNNKPIEGLFDDLIATCVDDPACLVVEPASKRRRTQNES